MNDGSSRVSWKGPTIEFQVLGGFFMRQGLYHKATECFVRSLLNTASMPIQEQAETRLLLAFLYQQDCNFTEAKIQLEKIDTNQVSDSELVNAVARATVAISEGEFEAASIYYQTLTLCQKMRFSLADERTIFIAHQLGLVYERLNKLEDAKKRYTQSLQAYRIRLGAHNPFTLKATEDLAQLLQLQGSFLEAQKLLEWIIYVKQRLLGVNHPSTALSISKYAALCETKGDFQAADSKHNAAFGIILKTLGRSHPIHLNMKESQARSYRNRALNLIRQGYQPFEAISGPPRTNASKCYYQKAASILSEVITVKSQNPDIYSELNIQATRLQLNRLLAEDGYFREPQWV
jgi:tetratricopeptide (TPR) repeat protein